MSRREHAREHPANAAELRAGLATGLMMDVTTLRPNRARCSLKSDLPLAGAAKKGG
jgi:hypothetical protein